MKPWDTVRREVLGAWRSVRYDLDHRSKADVESKANIEPKATVEAGNRAGGSTTIGFDGASTPIGFGGASAPVGVGGETDDWHSRPLPPQESRPLPVRESIWSPLRDPRRVMAALAVATVVAASATGTFLAVTGGLGILLVDSAGTPVAPQKTAPASAPHVVTSKTPRHRQAPVSHPPSPSVSASVRPSATRTARPAGPTKPAPSVAVTTVAPPSSPGPVSAPSTTVSDGPLPSATASAAPTP